VEEPVKRKFYPKAEEESKIRGLEEEAALKEKIVRIRQDALRERAAGHILASEKLWGYADQLAQRDLLPAPKKKKAEQLDLFGGGE
jgi:hypothetical protein